MTARAHHRGHIIEWTGAAWTYADGAPLDPLKPCVQCGQCPTPEGYDACLGYIQGASSVCCGHGVENPILLTHGLQKNEV